MARCMLLFVLLGSTAAPGQSPAWRAEVLLETPRGMGGAAIGDLDPDAPGNEVVVVNAAGEAWMVRRAAAKWEPVRIHAGAGELIMCAIGDVDPRYPGAEFVGVGMVRGEESRQGPGCVTGVRKQGDEWISTEIFRDDHMIHGVAVGDVAQRYAGKEIIACGFNHRVTLIAFHKNEWRHEVIYVANDRLKIAAIADVLPDRDGLKLVVSGSDGNVVLLWENELGWRHEIIYSDATGQSRVAAAPNRVLVGGDGGKVTLVSRDGKAWRSECIGRDAAKIRGVAIADTDPSQPGAEFYAAGYSANVSQLIPGRERVLAAQRHPARRTAAAPPRRWRDRPQASRRRTRDLRSWGATDPAVAGGLSNRLTPGCGSGRPIALPASTKSGRRECEHSRRPFV